MNNKENSIFIGRIFTFVAYFAIALIMLISAFTVEREFIYRLIVIIYVAISPLVCIIPSVVIKVNDEVRLKIYVIWFAIASIVLALEMQTIDIFLYVIFLETIPLFFLRNQKIFVFQIAAIFAALLNSTALGILGFSNAHIGVEHFVGLTALVFQQLMLFLVLKMDVVEQKCQIEQNRSADDMIKLVEAKCRDAETATKSKSNFLSNMSHEIRTPINSILGMNELIVRESKEEAIKGYAANIDSASKMLLALINEILDFSKIESGKMELVPTEYELPGMINDLVVMMESRVDSKGLAFNLEVDPHLPIKLYGDEVRLRQIITNILTNAIKYTEKGSVTMRVTGKKVADKVFLHIEIEDTGVGISDEDLPRLFEAFRRIKEDKNRNIEGTGLGMSISSQLLELMGSRLGVKSKEGVGSNFFFTVKQDIVDAQPIGDFKKRVTATQKAVKNNSKLFAPNARVLVVDDNDMNRKVFTQLLKRTGMHIDGAESGYKCLEMVENERYDLIFMDHMMPGMDGIETFHNIRNGHGPCKDIPVIILTANAVSGAREMYMDEGFTDFLTKPIMPAKLEAAIIQYLPPELVEGGDDAAGSKEINPDSSSTGANATGGNAAGAGAGALNQSTGQSEDWFGEPPADIDGLDWNLAKIHFTDKEIMMDTIKNFHLMIPRDADRLDEYFANLDDDAAVAEYKILVHSMKSSSALVGIIPLSGCAKILENAAGAQDRETIRAMHAVFIKQWKSYTEKLGVLFPKDPSEEKAFDRDEFLAHLDAILAAAEVLDIDTIDPEVQAVADTVLPWDAGSEITKLQGAAVELDTEQIGVIVNGLKEKAMNA